ncbi:MAG: GHKL domain-containing protein [Oscillospiraceae bacterium]|nr:GHKL domain-containing protein [Oscillospiraceae bacterium]
MSALTLFAVNLVCWVMWFAAFNLLLERRLSLGLTLLIELALFLPYYYLTQLLTGFLTDARALLGVAELLCAVLLLYRDKWLRKCRVVLLVMLLMFLSELFAAAVLPPEIFNPGIGGEEQQPYPLFAYGPYLFSQALLLCALVLVGRRLRRRGENGRGGAGQLLFLLFPASQLLLIVIWIRLVGQAGGVPDAGFVLLGVFLCAAADAALAFVLNAAAESAALRSKNELLREQERAQTAFGAALAGRQAELRALRRDILDRAEELRDLLRRGEEREAALRVRSLQERCGAEAGRLPGCEDAAAASFLYHRKRELEAAGVRLELALAIPAGLGLEETDLICALGNLLDNAAEACRESPEPAIRLQAEYRAPYLHIETRNPVPAPDAAGKRKPRRIPRLERGLGTEILKSLAARCDGQFLTAVEAGEYRASLILKEEAHEACDL